MTQKRAAVLALVLSVAAIAVATLTPVEQNDFRVLQRCIVCGDRGLSDAFLNVVMFAPLGAALGGLGWAGVPGVLGAAAFSSGLELLQTVVPGRDPSYGDLLFNGTGAVVGMLLLNHWRSILVPDDRTRTRWLVGWSVLVVASALASGWLLSPSPPTGAPYFGQWTPELAHLEHYEGEVHDARFAGAPVVPGEMPDSEPMRAGVIARSSMNASGVAGPEVPGLAPFVSVYDGARREVVLIGPDRTDLVWRYRTRTSDVRLDRPDLRWVGGLAGVSDGDALEVGARPAGDGWCLRANGRERCEIGYDAARGWAFLMYPEELPAWFMSLLDGIWLALLSLPLGYWALGRRGAVVALGAGITAWVLVPLFSPVLMATPALPLIAALVGGVAGRLLAVRVGLLARRLGPVAPNGHR